MADSMKVPIEVDIARAQYGLSQLKQRLRDTGAAGKNAGQQATGAFGKFGSYIKNLAGPAGIGMLILGVRSFLRAIDEADKRVDSLLRKQGERMRTGAQVLGADWIERLQTVMRGWSKQQIWQYTHKLGAKYDIKPEAAGGGLFPVWSTMGPTGAPATDIAKFGPIVARIMRTGAGGKISPTTAGWSFVDLASFYGLKGARQDQGMAEIIAGASESAYDPTQAGDIIARVVSGVKAKGLTRRQTIATAVGFSPFAKQTPTMVTRWMRQLGREYLQRNKFTTRLMRKHKQPENMWGMLLAWQEYLKGGAKPEALMQRAGIAPRSFEAVEKMMDPAFWQYYDAATKKMETATSEDWIERPFAARVAQPDAQTRMAESARQQYQYQFGRPGTSLQAENILGRWQDRLQGDLFQERMSAWTLRMAARRSTVGKYAPEADLPELYRLNTVYDRVADALQGVIDAATNATVRKAARYYRKALYDAKADANGWTGPLVDAKAKISRYRIMMIAAIRFLVRVRLGMPVTGPAEGVGAMGAYYTAPGAVATPGAEAGAAAEIYPTDDAGESIPLQLPAPGSPGSLGDAGALGVGGTVILNPANVYLNTPGERARNTLTKAGP